MPPEKIHSIIDTTPIWKPMVDTLKHLCPGGKLVINNIRKENTDSGYLANIDYARDLWMEKDIKSVANVTFNDIKGILEIASEHNIKPETQVFDLTEANTATLDTKLRYFNFYLK